MSNPSQENPYAAPDTEGRRHRGNRFRWWAIPVVVVLTSLSAVIGFCCTCYPIGLIGFGLSYPDGNAFGTALFFGAFPLGLLVASLLGFLVARTLLRRFDQSRRAEMESSER